MCRNAYQPAAYHGEAGAGPVRAVQPGGGPGRPRGGHQQETVAGDHQGARPPLLHHLRRIHAAHTVSLCNFSTFCTIFFV